MEILTIPVVLTSYRPKADKSVTITFNSNTEFSPDEIGKLAAYHQTQGRLIYKASDSITEQELKELDKVHEDFTDVSKSKAQRLRGVLYLLWDADNEGYGDFKDYYDFKMEALISHFKTKLD